MKKRSSSLYYNCTCSPDFMRIFFFFKRKLKLLLIVNDSFFRLQSQTLSLDNFFIQLVPVPLLIRSLTIVTKLVTIISLFFVLAISDIFVTYCNFHLLIDNVLKDSNAIHSYLSRTNQIKISSHIFLSKR